MKDIMIVKVANGFIIKQCKWSGEVVSEKSDMTAIAANVEELLNWVQHMATKETK